MSALILFSLLIILIFAGVPIAFSLGISSLVYLIMMDLPLNIIAQRMYTGIDSFVLLAIPGFILAGNLMNAGGITERIIKFAKVFVGHIRGGLALTNVGASMVFGGVSGTALADTATLGSVLIPAMKREGYPADFSAAVTASSSTVAPMIPPSVNFIIIGTLVGLPIGSLFLGGLVPGILLGLFLMLLTYIISVKRRYPKEERSPIREVIRSFFGGFWAILMVFVILYGILGGYFTPTEASIAAVIYAFIVGKFVYKDLKIKDIPKILLDSINSTSSIMILVGFANLFGWIMVSEQIPVLVANTILGVSENPIIVLLLILVLLLFVGTFMETIAALIILFPVLLPVAQTIGMDPIQFGVVFNLALVIGLTTPPLGVCMYVASSIGNVSMTRTSVALIPFIGVSIIVLLLITFIPSLTLYLPGLFN